MAGKLTKAQRDALEEIKQAGHASPYQLGVPSQVVGRLMRMSYVQQVRQIIVWDKFSMFRITDLGRAALRNHEEGQ